MKNTVICKSRETWSLMIKPARPIPLRSSPNKVRKIKKPRKRSSYNLPTKNQPVKVMESLRKVEKMVGRKERKRAVVGIPTTCTFSTTLMTCTVKTDLHKILRNAR